MTTNSDPLVAPPPAEVPLRQAPLVRVIAQVRFPLVVGVEQREFIAPFHQALEERYPILRQERTGTIAIVVGPPGAASPAPPQTQTTWRLTDVEGRWRASLAPDFLALETTAYESRADFMSRFREIVAVLNEHVEPKLVDRLGVRYIDRISGPSVNDLEKLVRGEVRGIMGTPVAQHAQHTLNESLFVLNATRLLARWGCLPPGATVDPAAIEPTNEPSWLLDLDMSSAEPTPFSVDRVVNDARQFAERIYAFFRWAVTDEFLRRYGGSV